MATRAIALPHGLSPTMRERGERVVLPLLCLLVVVAASASLGLALARLPSELAVPAPQLVPPAARRAPGALDPITQAPTASRPRSASPVGGFAFVRCTNLWTAYADGSNARRILMMPGLASPTFSPDGRTIAFLAVAAGGTEIWLAAADGSVTRRLGVIEQDGTPVTAEIGSLDWSPDGSRLSFAVTPRGIHGGTGTHWTLDLASGAFDEVGEGGDAAAWLGRQLLAAGRADGRVENLWGHRWASQRISRAGDVEAIAFAPGWWAWEWEKQTAMLLNEGAGDLELAWRKGPTRNGSDFATTAPEGYRFDPSRQMAVLQHGPVAVTLLDPAGGRDLGLYDPLTGEWQVLDYAWDAAASPAPPAVGGVERQHVTQLVQNLMWHLDRPARSALLLEEPIEHRTAPFDRLGFTLEPLVRRDGGWTIRVHAFGRRPNGFATQDLSVSVRGVDGRLAATVEPAGPIVPLRSVEDAVAYLERILTVRVLAPAGLPEGTRLAANAFDAWSWRGRATGTLHLVAPGTGRLSFFYGDGGLGCGSYPVPVELATGTPAIVQDPEVSGGFNAIAWPAGPRESSGPFGIWGEAPTSMLVSIASAMDATRRPS